MNVSFKILTYLMYFYIQNHKRYILPKLSVLEILECFNESFYFIRHTIQILKHWSDKIIEALWAILPGDLSRLLLRKSRAAQRPVMTSNHKRKYLCQYINSRENIFLSITKQ